MELFVVVVVVVVVVVKEMSCTGSMWSMGTTGLGWAGLDCTQLFKIPSG